MTYISVTIFLKKNHQNDPRLKYLKVYMSKNNIIQCIKILKLHWVF